MKEPAHRITAAGRLFQGYSHSIVAGGLEVMS